MNTDAAQTILWSCSAGVSVACLAYVVISTAQTGQAEVRRARVAGKQATSLLFKALRPAGHVFGILFGMVFARIEIALGRPAEKSYLLPARIWIERRLRAAAYPEGMRADEFLGLVLLGGAGGLLLGLLVNTRLGFGFVVLFFAAFGAYWPIIWLRGRVRNRQDDIRRRLPYAIDLLTLSVEAGLDFTQALARIVRKLGNTALANELGELLRDIQLGRTRVQALRELGRRVDLPELNSMVSSLIQADELGSSLGPILRVQADQLRQRRSQHAEKLAMEAPVKILLPLILFIFPTVFIMIFGPIVLKLVRH